jgi:hypothetical protein
VEQRIALDASGARRVASSVERCAIWVSCAKLPLQKPFGVPDEIDIDPSAEKLSTRP